MNTIREPSGDQRACLSWDDDDAVRFRVGPCSMGAVKTSPRATNSARSPFGLSAKLETWPPTAMRAGRAATPSFGTWMLMALDWPVRVSSTCSVPPIS
jgi:hypothetical protein